MNIQIDSNVQNIVFNGNDVQVLVYNGVEVWRKGSTPTHDYSLDYLTFEIISGNTINLTQVTQSGNVNKTVEYSINDGTWQSVSTGGYISCTTGDIIRLKGTNNTYTNGNSSSYNRNYVYFNFGSTYVNVYGNIMSLLNGDNFVNTGLTSSQKYAFCSLFKQTSTTTGGIVDASNLILPEGSQDGVFRAMFAECKKMTMPPQVRVSDFGTAGYVCYYMFQNCTSLVTAPDLLTVHYTDSKYLYGFMFTGCTALRSCKCLLSNPAFTSSGNCYRMFYGISTTGTLYKNADATWTSGGNGIPNTWTIVDVDV